MGIIAKYKFSNRKHPWIAVAASVFGIISIVSMILAVYLTYREGGDARFRYGMVCVLAMLFSAVGETLSVAAYFGKDRYPFFPVFGIAVNAISILTGLYIIYAGVYGL